MYSDNDILLRAILGTRAHNLLDLVREVVHLVGLSKAERGREKSLDPRDGQSLIAQQYYITILMEAADSSVGNTCPFGNRHLTLPFKQVRVVM